MTEETAQREPSVVAQVYVGEDAVFALTEQGAVFRNGQQMVIPHLGADYFPELMAALSTPEFTGAIADIRIRMAEVPEPMEELQNPVGREYAGTNWEGFEVEPLGVGFQAAVHHMHSQEGEDFANREEAENTLRDGVEIHGPYVVLCAAAYLAWLDQVEPKPVEPVNWHSWVRGDIVFYAPAENFKGIVAGPTPDDLVLITQNGQVITLSDSDLDLPNWRVGIAASHNIDPEALQ